MAKYCPSLRGGKYIYIQLFQYSQGYPPSGRPDSIIFQVPGITGERSVTPWNHRVIGDRKPGLIGGLVGHELHDRWGDPYKIQLLPFESQAHNLRLCLLDVTQNQSMPP